MRLHQCLAVDDHAALDAAALAGQGIAHTALAISLQNRGRQDLSMEE